MNTTLKGGKPVFAKLVSLFLILVLFFHVTMSLVYNFVDTSRQPALVANYMDPLFAQNFKIFAPDVPVEKAELFFKYYTEKEGWSAWQNPGQEHFYAFQSNRFSTNRYPLFNLQGSASGTANC